MSRYVFDIETNGLLDKLDICWIISAYNLDTFNLDFWLPFEGDTRWMEIFNNATLLVGHNILDFDFSALHKLFGWSPNRKTKIHDTLIMSEVLNYKRFSGDSHSMEAWGNALGKPKQEHEDWSKYSPEMQTRCTSDVMLNVDIYKVLTQELKDATQRSPKIITYLQAEHAVSTWCSQAGYRGWPFNKEKAETLFGTMAAELKMAEERLTPRLGMKSIATDKKNGIVEEKTPKWRKDGYYNHHTANWFNLDPIFGLLEEPERIISGPYCRVEFADLDLNSVSDVKIFLYRNGWQPTDWNYKTDENTNEKTKTSPKITEDSLEFLGGDGKLYVDFLATKSRHSILKGWLEHCDSNNRVHGECFTIGTPSFRARHSIIVNVPSVEAAWGPEMRSLFTVVPGWKFIGADSASNQARGLAHYLGNDDFTNQLINGDIHTYNAGVLDEVLREIGFNWTAFILKREPDKTEKEVAKTKRAAAKRILYAFLFGASGGKLWLYITGTLDDTQGKKLKAGFLKKVPGFKDLMKKLENIYGSTSQYGPGYIYGLAGQKIYVDSFHKLLVYLLQAAEKATVAGACMLLMKWLEEENIPYQPLIMMHDELDFMTPEEYAPRAAELAKKAFKEGPKLFDVNIMDGDAKIGLDWNECH